MELQYTHNCFTVDVENNCRAGMAPVKLSFCWKLHGRRVNHYTIYNISLSNPSLFVHRHRSWIGCGKVKLFVKMPRLLGSSEMYHQAIIHWINTETQILIVLFHSNSNVQILVDNFMVYTIDTSNVMHGLIYHFEWSAQFNGFLPQKFNQQRGKPIFILDVQSVCGTPSFFSFFNEMRFKWLFSFQH